MHGLTKFNPLPTGARPRCGTYLHDFDVPYNALHDRGYPQHRLRAVHARDHRGEDIRAGRWWWEQPGVTRNAACIGAQAGFDIRDAGKSGMRRT